MLKDINSLVNVGYMVVPSADGNHTYVIDYRMGLRLPKDLVAAPCSMRSEEIKERADTLFAQVESNMGEEIPFPLDVPVPDKCHHCDGTGYITPCGECDGNGDKTCEHCGSEVECNECSGSGYLVANKGDFDAELCDSCLGDGLCGEGAVELSAKFKIKYVYWLVLRRVLCDVRLYDAGSSMLAIKAKLPPDLFNLQGIEISGIVRTM